MNDTSQLIILVTKGGSVDIIDFNDKSYPPDCVKVWDTFDRVKENAEINNLFQKQPELHKHICAYVHSTDEWIVDMIEHELDPSRCYFTEWFYVPNILLEDW